MPRYLISFNDGDMAFPEEDLPDVARDCRAVVQEAADAGVFVFAGGMPSPVVGNVVSTEGMITDGPFPETKEYIGGFVVVDVPTVEEALKWGAKIAAGCRCAQTVREFLPDPLIDRLLGGDQ